MVQMSRDGDALRYHTEQIELDEPATSHALLVVMTGGDKRVLETGPATGYVTKLLQEAGCSVVGIEVDSVAAAMAAPYCERMIIGDLETLDFDAVLKDDRFDAILFGDVLEHLVEPGQVLLDMKRFLAPGGRIIASIPNVAHASLRLGLLAGRFHYVEAGLLDRTHLRFFTKKSIEELFDDAGYEIQEWRSVLLDPFEGEVPLQESDFPPALIQALRKDPDALTYQYVLSATAAEFKPPGSNMTRNGAHAELSPGLKKALNSITPPSVHSEPNILASRVQDAERELAHSNSERTRAVWQMERVHAELARRYTELELTRTRVDYVEALLEERQRELEDLDARTQDELQEKDSRLAEYDELLTLSTLRLEEMAEAERGLRADMAESQRILREEKAETERVLSDEIHQVRAAYQELAERTERAESTLNGLRDTASYRASQLALRVLAPEGSLRRAGLEYLAWAGPFKFMLRLMMFWTWLPKLVRRALFGGRASERQAQDVSRESNLLRIPRSVFAVALAPFGLPRAFMRRRLPADDSAKRLLLVGSCSDEVATKIVKAVEARFPAARIDAFVSGGAAHVAPEASERVHVEQFDSQENRSKPWAFLRRLQRQRYDITVVVFSAEPGFGKRKLMGLFSGSQIIIVYNENADAFLLHLVEWKNVLRHISWRLRQSKYPLGLGFWTPLLVPVGYVVIFVRSIPLLLRRILP